MPPTAKDIRVAPIGRADADRIVKAVHYSGKTVNNQFGPSLDKRKLMGLVADTGWNDFIELNRMAFSEALPRNSESRAIGVAMRMIRKAYPHLQWVVSFSDGTQCGDGTIYRASGFVLTGIRKNTSIWVALTGETITDITVKSSPLRTFSRTALTDQTSAKQKADAHSLVGCNLNKGGGASMKAYREAGFRPLDGYQLRYVYFLNASARERLTVPVLPFSDIGRLGAGMYRGQKRVASDTIDTAAVQADKGGETPTATLQSS